jgi:uncharacterized metal-binding protein
MGENCKAGAGDTLLFGCSGSADVGALADQAARALTMQGVGKMYCLAGVGGKVPGIVEKTRFAKRRVVLDGCPMDCGKHSLLSAGITEFDHVRLYENGFEKGKTPVNNENISKVTKMVLSLIEKK